MSIFYSMNDFFTVWHEFFKKHSLRTDGEIYWLISAIGRFSLFKIMEQRLQKLVMQFMRKRLIRLHWFKKHFTCVDDVKKFNKKLNFAKNQIFTKQIKQIQNLKNKIAGFESFQKLISTYSIYNHLK